MQVLIETECWREWNSSGLAIGSYQFSQSSSFETAVPLHKSCGCPGVTASNNEVFTPLPRSIDLILMPDRQQFEPSREEQVALLQASNSAITRSRSSIAVRRSAEVNSILLIRRSPSWIAVLLPGDRTAAPHSRTGLLDTSELNSE